MLNKKNISEKNPLGFTLGIFYFCAVLLLSALPATVWCQAKIKIEDSKKNFGHVQRGEIIVNTYTVENTGNEPLLLKQVDIPCTCTRAEFDEKPILPGKNTFVKIIFNTKTVYGRQDRTVILQSNDPWHPETKLRFKGTVSMK